MNESVKKKENILGTLNKNYLLKKFLKSIGLCPWQFDLYKKKVFLIHSSIIIMINP